MVVFHRYRQEEGLSKAETLQAAQAEIRQDEDYADPYYWAAFLLNGNPDPGF